MFCLALVLHTTLISFTLLKFWYGVISNALDKNFISNALHFTMHVHLEHPRYVQRNGLSLKSAIRN